MFSQSKDDMDSEFKSIMVKENNLGKKLPELDTSSICNFTQYRSMSLIPQALNTDISSFKEVR